MYNHIHISTYPHTSLAGRVCLFLAGRMGLEGPAREPPAALDTGGWLQRRDACCYLFIRVLRTPQKKHQHTHINTHNTHNHTTTTGAASLFGMLASDELTLVS